MSKVFLGIKVGMTQIFEETGKQRAVTVVSVAGNRISRVIGGENPTHIEIGMGKKEKANKADSGNYKQLGFVPEYKIVVPFTGETQEIGTEIGANIFEVGSRVKVSATSKGKGFQGVVKRWGFHGGPKTHGQSDKHRHPGSIGAGTTPGRIIKGLKMGGRMGGDKVTVANLKVVDVDTDNQLIVLGGSIPGNIGSLIVIKA
jgi:large subunit ribosomal protein L3